MTSTNTGITTGRKRRGYGTAVAGLAVAIVLTWSTVCAAGVPNSSFETYYLGTPYPRQLPTNWWHTDHPSFNSKCTGQWSTDGNLSAGLYSLVNKPINPGNFQGFHQFVNLTGIGTIMFDVRLATYPEGNFEHFAATFLVDNVPLWSKTEGGVYLNQQVKVQNKSGYHRIEMRIAAAEAGWFPLAYWTQWDNIRLIEGPTAIPARITLDPNTLNLSSNGRWITAYIELETGFDPNGIDGSTVTLGGSVPAYMGDQGWATPEANYENVSDFDGDGVAERMVRFDRATVQSILQGPEATVVVKGNMFEGQPFGSLSFGSQSFESRPFEGTGVIRVIDKGPKEK